MNSDEIKVGDIVKIVIHVVDNCSEILIGEIMVLFPAIKFATVMARNGEEMMFATVKYEMCDMASEEECFQYRLEQ